MDATENEAAKLTVNSFPTVMLYKKGAKENPVSFKGKRDSAHDIMVWLKHNSQAFAASPPDPRAAQKANSKQEEL